MNELEGRLSKLERENKWFKRAGVSALVALGAVVLMGQAPPEATVADPRQGR